MDATSEDPAITTVLRMLGALERGAEPDEIGRLLTPDAIQREYPSLVGPTLTERGREEMLSGSVAGRRLLRRQHYEVHEALSAGERVVLRLTWTAELAEPLGTLPAGAALKSHVALFATVRNGRIAFQESYDCYEPFTSTT